MVPRSGGAGALSTKRRCRVESGDLSSGVPFPRPLCVRRGREWKCLQQMEMGRHYQMYNQKFKQKRECRSIKVSLRFQGISTNNVTSTPFPPPCDGPFACYVCDSQRLRQLGPHCLVVVGKRSRRSGRCVGLNYWQNFQRGESTFTMKGVY